VLQLRLKTLGIESGHLLDRLVGYMPRSASKPTGDKRDPVTSQTLTLPQFRFESEE
jgi:hypothetical protein